MRARALLATLICGAAVVAAAQDHHIQYKFHVVAERDGIRFADAAGTRWKYLALGCGPNVPGCEMRINDVGGFMRLPDDPSNEDKHVGVADLGFVQNPDHKTLRVICRQKACTVNDAQLVKGGALEISIGDDVHLDITREP